MNSKIPKWMPRESAGCFSHRAEEASQSKVEMDSGKRLRNTVESERGVEEFLRLLDRIEETKKHLKRKRTTNCSGSSCSAGISAEEHQRMNITPGMRKGAQGSDFVSLGASSPWKPSFQWEDFITNPLSVQTDLSCAATTEMNNCYAITTAAEITSSTDENHRGGGGGGEDSIKIGSNHLKTISFLDIIAHTTAGCSHDHVDDFNKERDVDAPPELELRLFPI